MRDLLSRPSSNPLNLKLAAHVRLLNDDRRTLDSLAQFGIRVARAREDIISEGDEPRAVNLILEGWACRYKTLEDGRRQNIAFLLPGDFCDLHAYILKEMDHSIGTLTPVRYAQIPAAVFEEYTSSRPNISRAFTWDTLVTAAIQREWTVNIGQRSALERVAHLFCELHLRLHAIGLAQDGVFELPVTQIDLAEATGMTSVHINRTVQELRARGYIHWKGKHIEVPNLRGLRNIAHFNANYLHLEHIDDQRSGVGQIREDSR